MVMILFAVLLTLAGSDGDMFLMQCSQSDPAPEADGENRTFDLLFIQYRSLFRDILGRRCVYAPSCSEYGQRVISAKGPVLGVMIALERWTRCNGSARSTGDYSIGTDNRLEDSPEPGEEVTSWGSLLLPF